MIIRIIQVGGSRGVTLLKDLLDRIGLDVGAELELLTDEDGYFWLFVPRPAAGKDAGDGTGGVAA